MNRNFFINMLMAAFIFVFIYTPPVIPVNPLHILTVISIAMIAVKYKFERVLSILSDIHVRIFMTGVLISVFFLTLTLGFTTHRFVHIYQILILLFEVLPCSVFIVLFLKDRNIKIDDFLVVLLHMGLLQSAFAIVTFLFPAARDFILGLHTIEYFSNPAIKAYAYSIRIFGFALGYMFATPVTQGFLAVIAVLVSLKKSIKFMVYVPPLVFSAMINARVGVIIFVIGCLGLFVAALYERQAKNLVKFFAAVFICVSLFPFCMNLISSYSSGTRQWLSEGVSETISFINGENTGYYYALSNMVFLPDPIDMIFGTGQSVYGNTSNIAGKASDVGYIIDLFLGGLLYMMPLYMSILILPCHRKTKNNLTLMAPSVLMPLCILTANIKGQAFVQNEFLNIYILISIALIGLKEQEESTG